MLKGETSASTKTPSLSPFCLFMALQSARRFAHIKLDAVTSLTPTTDGAPAPARDFPRLVSLYKLRTITKAPATVQYRGAKHAHDSSRGPPAPSAPLIYSFSSPPLPSSVPPSIQEWIGE